MLFKWRKKAYQFHIFKKYITYYRNFLCYAHQNWIVYIIILKEIVNDKKSSWNSPKIESCWGGVGCLPPRRQKDTFSERCPCAPPAKQISQFPGRSPTSRPMKSAKAGQVRHCGNCCTKSGPSPPRRAKSAIVTLCCSTSGPSPPRRVKSAIVTLAAPKAGQVRQGGSSPPSWHLLLQ